MSLVKQPLLQLRRYKDIVAFRQGDGPALAYQARNLELAEITDELWQSMQPTQIDTAEWIENTNSAESTQLLEEWNAASASAPTAHASKKSRTLTINITQICNLHCHYCAAGGDGTYGDPVRQISVEKTLPQIRMMMDQLSEGDGFHIIFLGGEPLLYPEAIRGIALYTQELASQRLMTASFSIITNGTLITPRFIELMNGIKPAITFSMDGPPEINDRVRPQKSGQGSSEKALQGLELLLRHRSHMGPITIHSVLSSRNTAVVQSYLFFKKYPVKNFEFTLDVANKDSATADLFTQQLQEVAGIAYHEGGEEELRRLVIYNQYFTALDAQIPKSNHCGSGKTLFSLSARNEIYACPLDVGHKSRQVGQNEEIQSAALQKLQVPLIELNNCQMCWARHLCGGGCMYSHRATTGNAHEKHPTYCKRTRNLIIDAMMYYKLARAEGAPYGKNETNESAN